MCGRYVSPDQAAIERLWHIGRRNSNPFAARYNAAPTQLLPIIRASSATDREVALLRWGLIPSWAKDPAIGARMINARAETVADRPAFRVAFRQRRCLVPMRGFYEWRKVGDRKVPHYVHLRDADLFAVAGLYERWAGRDGAEPIESYTIITTDANELVATLHNRMPAIVRPELYPLWLDPTPKDREKLMEVLRPYPGAEMTAHPVSDRVNSPANDEPSLIE